MKAPEYLQVFLQARTAHFEIASDCDPKPRLVYIDKSYDFDESAHIDSRATRLNYFGLVRLLISGRFDIIEINEPLFLRAIPLSLLTITIASLKALLSRKRARIVSYAIENNDVSQQLRSHFPLPEAIARNLVRLVSSFLLRRIDLLAFGTPGARANYLNLTKAKHWPENRVFLELPSADDPDGSKTTGLVIFVGSFDERKGVLPLVESWPLVASRVEEASLAVIGRGPLSSELFSRTSVMERAIVVNEPTREEVLGYFQKAKVAVLFSQSNKRWKEQLGLPILEGLAAGCEIVASDATGIADWLKETGHAVLPESASKQALAEAIIAALQSTRTAEQVKASLPDVHGRVAVHSWFAGLKFAGSANYRARSKTVEALGN